jgi:hypothetical protein
MSMICVAGTAWALSAPAQLVGVLLLVGVGVGLPTGMLLKILPFLSWFHLQHLQMASGRLDVRVPYMQGFISERFARFHLALHLSTLAILATAVMLPGLALVGGVLLCLSGLVLEVILLMSVLRYSRVALSLKTTMVPSSAEPG